MGHEEHTSGLSFADSLTFLSIDEAVWRSSWELATKCRTNGLTISPTDLLIIAVALFHDAEIIHFDRHFDLYHAWSEDADPQAMPVYRFSSCSMSRSDRAAAQN